MKKLYPIFCALLLLVNSHAQFAPNFNLLDISGDEHELYSYLDDGKVVILDFYAVWCGPCQDNAAAVEEVWKAYGPDGTDEIMILGIEGDVSSTDQEVSEYAIEYGCGNPQINESEDAMDLFNVQYYPTYLVVCPDRSYIEYDGLPDEIEAELIQGLGLCAPKLDIDLDARIFDYNSATTLCSEETTPNFTLMNMGNESLISVSIKTYLNGSLFSMTDWSGNLSQFDYENISLEAIDLTGIIDPEIMISLENPNGSTDQNNENDVIMVMLSQGGINYETDSLRFELAFDNFPQETTWEFLNSVGEVILSGGDYIGFPNFSPPIDTFIQLPKGDCFTFNIYDSVGDGICCAYADDGEGYWKISTDEAVLIAEGGVFTDIESALFGIESEVLSQDEVLQKPLNIYPNPASDFLVIEHESLLYQWEILGIDGRQLIQGESKNMLSTKIDLGSLASKGIFLVKITTDEYSICQKLMIY